jgi:thiamine kinase-like enzyme
VVLNGRRATAIIDFDTAHPGPRTWDIAYALYRWSPLKNPDNPDTLGNLESQIHRARQFCDTYGLPMAERHNLVSIIIERLQTLIHHMQDQAQKGNPTFQAHLAEGHHRLYQDDIIYLQQNRNRIQGRLTSKS